MIKNTLKHILIGIGLYLVLLLIIIQEPIQSGLVYINWLNFPTKSALVDPESLGFDRAKVRNFYIDSTDNVKLGVWQFLPTDYYERVVAEHDQPLPQQFDPLIYNLSLNDPTRQTILFLHGNAGNRGSSVRYPAYRSIYDGLKANLFVPDYRGFGDSNGKPSELGLISDGLATLNYMVNELNIPLENITIMGHSLGTGVASKLVFQLNQRNVSPKALILSAPYSSILEAMFDYRFFRIVPLLYPAKSIPNIHFYIKPYINHLYDTKSVIKDIKTDTLILHGHKDLEIPIKHAQLLFNTSLPLNQRHLIQSKKVEDGTIQWLDKFNHENNRFISFLTVDLGHHDNLPSFNSFKLAITELWGK